MAQALTGLSCPKCSSDARVIGRTPRSGPYPEMLTLRCTECGEVFTSPENPDRPFTGLPPGDLDRPVSPTTDRRDRFRYALTTA